MADTRNKPNSHWTNLKGKFRNRVGNPTNPVVGDMFFDTSTNALMRYTGNNWVGIVLT